jgi:lipoate-protein ligase A
VLQGPGCLNYALALRLESHPPLRSVAQTNAFVMRRHQTALSQLLGRRVAVEGYTDLTLAGRKFSGNSQRRRRHALLFHGTFLLHFDLARIGLVLHLPARQPAYRCGRSHAEFLTNLELPAAAVKETLQRLWETRGAPEAFPAARVAELAEAKYRRPAWVERC